MDIMMSNIILFHDYSFYFSGERLAREFLLMYLRHNLPTLPEDGVRSVKGEPREIQGL